MTNGQAYHFSKGWAPGKRMGNDVQTQKDSAGSNTKFSDQMKMIREGHNFGRMDQDPGSHKQGQLTKFLKGISHQKPHFSIRMASNAGEKLNSALFTDSAPCQRCASDSNVTFLKTIINVSMLLLY